MGLFSFKKKKEKEEELDLSPPLKFSEFPSEFPKYEPGNIELSEIKQAVEPPKISLNQRFIERRESPSFSELSQRFQPNFPQEVPEVSKKDKDMFVKIERYERAMQTMESIKTKLEEANLLLNKLQELKKREENEIMAWHQDLISLKEKLISLDKTLFER